MVKYRENLATEIIGRTRKKLWWCRVALVVSLAGNIIQAIALVIR